MINNFYKVHLKFPSGDQYEGEWKKGEPNGKGNKDSFNFYIGTYTWDNGAKYEGEWKEGKKNGIGNKEY